MTHPYQSRRNFLKNSSLISAAIPLGAVGEIISRKPADTRGHSGDSQTDAAVAGSYGIRLAQNRAEISAGSFVREIEIAGNRIETSGLRVHGTDILAGRSPEFQVDFYQAFPNARPVGLTQGADGRMIWADGTPATSSADNQPVEWKLMSHLDGRRLADQFKIVSRRVCQPARGVHRLQIRARCFAKNSLEGVFIEVYYEIYEGYPAIRKWIEFTNNGSRWLKIDNLLIEDIALSPDYRKATPLTPAEQGVTSSIIAFGNLEDSLGIIASSEVPAGTRAMGETGGMGYHPDYFEWVIGPSEHFSSEPVFYFAYAGEVIKTVSTVSTPLDRAVETPFKSFLQHRVGLRGPAASVPAPIWCSYTNFLVSITDENMREQADIAEKIGFVTFQLDEGWAGTPSPGGSEPSRAHMPDFDNTCKYITAKGLKLGLWISCFRGDDAKDLVALPYGKSLPLSVNTKRGDGMSFASKWRDYFGNDIIYMADRYGMGYVKQDLTNIQKGDIAEGHESRTRKESVLRGLRGLLELNRRIGEQAPEIWTQITHELYWRTPGPSADIAALKHACAFHTTPNTYKGSGNGSKRVSQDWPFDPVKLRAELTQSCHQAREIYFAHRGLPLYSVEFYAANAVNIKGSLTAGVQDRQICSWLMGAPTVFAGDLSSLSPAHIAHYRRRFDLLKSLQATYDIYRYFQYSGVPRPTDTNWHWWGKLNAEGSGVVVVLRGSDGEDTRRVNIPWVDRKKTYRATAHFAGGKPVIWTGAQLIEGALRLSLPRFGQEIIELSALS